MNEPNNKNIIIDACGFSDEMKEYLKAQELSDYKLTCIIAGSLLKLEEKMKLYKLIDDDADYYFSARQFYDETEKAIAELKLKSGEMLALHECWYDDDIPDEKREFSEPFTTFDAAMKYLKELIKDEEWDETTLCWTMLEKWAPNGDGTMKNTYTYYLVNNEIMYFEREDFRGYVSSMSLNLPIPFKVGDIVTLNSIPFAPPKQAILLEVENTDCCGVQMLYRLENGLWETGALKHGYGWGHGFPMLSTLYSLSKFEGELKDEDKLMLEVQEYIRKDEKNGKALWDAFFLNKYCGESTAYHENLIRSIIKNKTEAFTFKGDVESEGKHNE